ncbi:MAG: cyclic nucleotide-binding domain-containing protein [Acidimicrobiia bacterium]
MLGEVPLFAGLTKGQMRAVAKVVDHAIFEPGAVLVKEADTGSRLILIRSGTAAVIRGGTAAQERSDGGVEQGSGRRIATVGPGDLVGEMALIDGWPTSASVVAETPLEALLIYRTRFNELLKSTPELYPGLLRAMAARTRSSNRPESTIA